jgi:hypothetical protein
MIKKVLKIITTIIFLIIIIFVGLLSVVASKLDFGNLCGNEVFKEYYSPDKSMKAIIFQRDCGATTGFSTHISLFDVNKEFDDNEAGNIFLIRGHPKTVAPEITWTSNKNIIIHHHIDGKEVRIENKFGWINPIKITYE